MPGAARFVMRFCWLFLYMTIFVPMVKRAMFRHCPTCHHMLGRHQYRQDGSFRD